MLRHQNLEFTSRYWRGMCSSAVVPTLLHAVTPFRLTSVKTSPRISKPTLPRVALKIYLMVCLGGRGEKGKKPDSAFPDRARNALCVWLRTPYSATQVWPIRPCIDFQHLTTLLGIATHILGTTVLILTAE